MPTSSDLEYWGESQTYTIPLDKYGRIVDYIEPQKTWPNTPEERVRQRAVQSLHIELGYPKNLIRLECSLSIGREKKRADIVVFATESARAAGDQSQAVIIGEVKQATVKSPDSQLTSYICASAAQGGFWTNGDSVTYYRKMPDDGAIDTWIGLPKYGQPWDAVGRCKKSDLVCPVDLKIAFRRCHNAIYRSGSDSEDVAMDMVRILLAKLEDEMSEEEDCDFYITPEEYVTDDGKLAAARRVRRLFEGVRKRYGDVFGKDEGITASDKDIATVITFMQGYSLLTSPYDVIGTAYEVYVASHLKGEHGQYFTNRLAINMMVRMMKPCLQDTILDPACGSGGFLLSCMSLLAKDIEASGRSPSAKAVLKQDIPNHLFGLDTAPKLVKVAKTNMLLGKDGHTGIQRANSLGDLKKELQDDFRSKAGLGKPTLILTNPPFGSGFDLREKDAAILRLFRIGHIWNLKDGRITYKDSLNTSFGVAPELLFLERCIEWASPGGRIGIVMARGQLDDKGARAARQLVLDKCRLLGVVNLHEDTFEPFCGSRASILFLEKKRPGEDDSYRIFMALSNKIGQTSRGEPIYLRDDEGNQVFSNNQPVLDHDLDQIADDYADFLRGELHESTYRFSLSRDELDPATLSFNPTHYLPTYSDNLAKTIRLGERDDYRVHRLGDLGSVFNGPRFKRPYAAVGTTEGPNIRKYFTGTALSQYRSENIKYLDAGRANKRQKKDLDLLTVHRGWLLISDSGTLGRVTYALKQHEGHVATNNLIRVVIDDPLLRGYVYQFLSSSTGQSLLLKDRYGTNQEHLEPESVREVPIPIPDDHAIVKRIGEQVVRSMLRLEESLDLVAESQSDLDATLTNDANTDL